MDTSPKGTTSAAATAGTICRRIRRRLGLSQIELGRRLEWPQNTISQYEIGRACPSAKRLYQLFAMADQDERAQFVDLLRKLGLPVHITSIGGFTEGVNV